MLTAVVVVLCVFVALYAYLTRNFRYWRGKGVESVPHPVPLFGNFLRVLTFRTTIGEYLREVYDAFPDASCVGLYALDRPSLVVRSPELIRSVMLKDFHKFGDRNACLDESVDPVAAHFLFLMKNPEWKYSRAKLSPIFSSGKMKAMLPLMEEAGRDLEGHLRARAARGETLDARDCCAKYVTDVTVSCVFGLRGGSFEDDRALFRNLGKRMFKADLLVAVKQTLCFLAPDLASLLRFKFFDACLYDVMTEQFVRVFEERKKSGKTRNDLIEVFVKFEDEERDSNGMIFDKSWLLGQAVNFFGAGIETSTSIMAFALYELCFAQEVQRRVREEIRARFACKDDLSYESLRDLKYLHMVVSGELGHDV